MSRISELTNENEILKEMLRTFLDIQKIPTQWNFSIAMKNHCMFVSDYLDKEESK